MTVRRVLYALRLTQETKAKLKIVSFKKVNSKGKKSNVYFVEFATLADADLAVKQCRRLGHMTLKEYVPQSTQQTSTNQPAPSESIPRLTDLPRTIPLPLSTPAVFRKASEQIPSVRHVSSELAPNSSMVRTLMDVLRSCLAVIETAQKSAERTRTPLFKASTEQRDKLLQRLYHDHTTAYYMKVTTLAQLKAVNASHLRLSWEETSQFIQSFKNSILFEQSFVTETASLTKMHAKINFRESIVLTSQIACQISKLIKT